MGNMNIPDSARPFRASSDKSLQIDVSRLGQVTCRGAGKFRFLWHVSAYCLVQSGGVGYVYKVVGVVVVCGVTGRQFFWELHLVI